MDAIDQPKKGLPPEQALEGWSDPAAYSAMLGLADASRRISVAGPPTPAVLRHRQYRNLRDALELAFTAKLLDGTILASGIPQRDTQRRIIDPSLWEILEIDWGLNEIVGPQQHYDRPEFFEPSAIPLNIRTIPEWLSAKRDHGFRHSEDYRDVGLGNSTFILSNTRAKVVRGLHQAALEGNPWQSGKQVLSAAGSSSWSMRDVFKGLKNWQELVESNGRGEYRLRLKR